MHTQELLQPQENGCLTVQEHGWTALDALHIQRKHYPDVGLSVLNYHQCLSPADDPVVRECRSLILNDKFEVVSRAFDRFFHLQEEKIPIDWKKAVVQEKLDGSLVKLYFFDKTQRWELSTRSTAFAEGRLHRDANETYRDYILKAAGITESELQALKINPKFTYIFEVVGPENRIVTPYHECQMILLGARSNQKPYEELDTSDLVKLCVHLQNRCNWNIRLPVTYDLNDITSVQKGVASLTDLQEGFVVYDGTRRVKVKNSLYVKVHHLRHKKLDETRVYELILSGELKEYLLYFPEDEETVKPFQRHHDNIQQTMRQTYDLVRNITSPKQFAHMVTPTPYAWVLFSTRKEGLNDPWLSFMKAPIKRQLSVLMTKK